MKKGKRRLLTGALCVTLLFADIFSTGFTVSANELKQETSAVNEDGRSSVESVENADGAEGSEADREENTDGAEEAGEGSGTETPGGSGETGGETGTEVPDGSGESGEGSGTETPGGSGETGEGTETEAPDGSEESGEGTGTETPDDPDESEEGTETEVPDDSGQTGTEGAEEEEFPEIVSENSIDEADVQETVEVMSTPYEGKVNDITWKIDKYNWLILEGSGDYITEDEDGDVPPWAAKGLDFGGARVNIKGLTTMKNMFYRCDGLRAVDLSKQDMSHVTDMSGMFYGCADFRTLTTSDSGLDMSHVTNTAEMFYDCDALKELSVENWDMGNIRDMSGMFRSCDQLAKLEVGGWNTGSAEDMSGLFSGCSALTALDVSGWNTGNVRDMSGLFSGCSALTALDVSKWNTSRVNSMSGMFGSCHALTSLDVSQWDTSKVFHMSGMFSVGSYEWGRNEMGGPDLVWVGGSLRDLDVSRFDTSSVMDMASMFQGCIVRNLDLSGFQTARVTDMSNMFYNCGALTNLNLASFQTARVTDMNSMFYGCSSLTNLDLSSFQTGNVGNTENMFSGCSSLTGLDLSSFDLSMAKGVMGIASCKSAEYICTPKNCFLAEELPASADGWYGEDGKKYTSLPRMRSDSMVLRPGEGAGQREAVFLSGITAADKVYDGQPFAYEGRAVVKDSAGQEIAGVTVTGPFYTGTLMNGTGYSRTKTAPVRAGNYTMTFEVSGLDTTKCFLTGATSSFRIERRELTITLPPQTVALGGQIPDANSFIPKCTVEGLQGAEKLVFSLEYDEDEIPNDQSGIYEIIVWGDWIDYGSDEDGSINDYTLPDVCGTLTVGRPTGGLTPKPIASGVVGGISWRIDRSGKLTIEGKGDYVSDKDEFMAREGAYYQGQWQDEDDTPPWSSGRVTTAEVRVSGIRSMRGLFAGCDSLVSVDLSGTDTGNVVDMSYMFRGCRSLQKVDLSHLKTDKTETLRGMFYDCRSLEELDLSSFRVGQVDNVGELFYDCRSLVNVDLSSFETSKIVYMCDMFSGCCNLTDLDLSGLDVSNVWLMDGMFAGCSSLNYLFTPRNCSEDEALPRAEGADQWKAQDGTVYTSLPKGRAESILLYRNGCLENENGELKQILTLSGIRAESKVYDGRSNPYAGTAVLTNLEGAVVSDIALTCLYAGTMADGTPYAESETAPSQAGNYILSVNVAGDMQGRYVVRRNTYKFDITRRPLTISAPKIIIDTDDPDVTLPPLTQLQYTAEGLVDGEELAVKPSLRYSPEPAVPVQAGRYKIIPYGADAGNNYQISYVNGMLFIGDCGDVGEEDLPLDGVIPKGLWIAGLSEAGYTYTGKAIKPAVRVYDHTTLLREKTDYTIAYKNNTKAYEYDSSDKAFSAKKAPTITVTGKGNYTGKDTQTFRIQPLDIGAGTDAFGNDVFSADDMTVAYNKKAQKPVPALWWNDKKLKNKTDYTVSYYKGGGTAKLDSVKDVGGYYIELTGKGNFTGTRRIGLTVTDHLKLMSKMSVGKVKNQPYTGNAIIPEITVKDGRTVLEKGTHYTVRYSRNTAVGTAYIVIQGVEAAGYSGTKRISFKITGTPISKATVKDQTGQVFKGKEYIYGGADFEPALRLSLQVKKDGVATEQPLTADIDYATSWQKNRNAGTATVIFTGKGAYTGTLKKTFKIRQFDIAANADSRIIAALENDTVPFAKGGAKPGAVITFRTDDGSVQTLTEGQDYTLSYKNNKAKNDGSDPAKVPTVTIKGKGNFKGIYSTPLTYRITAQDIGNLTFVAADKTYQNKKNIYATKITITDLDGKVLKAGTDYDSKTASYTYKNDTAVKNGTAANAGTIVRSAGEAVDKSDVIPAGTVLTVTVRAKDGGNYEKTVTGDYRITKAPISTVSIAIPTQTYTGQEITPDESQMTVKIKGKAVEKDEDGKYGELFEIVPGSYKNNIKKGTASVTIRGVDNYGGTKVIKFKIKAKGFLWWWK